MIDSKLRTENILLASQNHINVLNPRQNKSLNVNLIQIALGKMSVCFVLSMIEDIGGQIKGASLELFTQISQVLIASDLFFEPAFGDKVQLSVFGNINLPVRARTRPSGPASGSLGSYIN
ncbi:hypothetical protein Ddc_13803 [Ditylenchus destructor]|nr:hypothetical protein Ddc_13803 [Ditylenchus destructor]